MTSHVIAHRGDSAHYPENTLLAFKRALALGARHIECDVRLSSDGQVIVIHDATLERTTSGQGPVRAASLRELKTLSAGYASRFGASFASERVPTLAETLDLLRGRAALMIELKTDTLPAAERSLLVQATIGEVLRAQARHDVALISFDREALREAHARAPAILHGHLFARVSEDDILAGTRAIDSRLAMPEKSLITPSLCEKAAAAGLQLATWVVDDVGEWRRLASLGLYGVGSNCPGDLLSAARDAPHSAEHTTTT